MKKTYTIAGLAFLLILITGIGFISTNEEKEEPGKVANIKKISADTSVNPVDTQKTKTRYDFSEDQFNFKESRIRRNQFLADILLDHNVSYPKINQLAEQSRKTFDIRDLKAGNTYCIISSKEDTAGCRYLVYEKDPINYVLFDLGDSLRVVEKKKEVTVKRKSASGIIQSSLYETLDEKDLSPLLALKLSGIYAWSIDFYRIKKGDKFKMIYEEKWVDGEPVKTGEIITALFNHQGEDFYAFSFQQGDKQDYFDEEANSLRKELLKAPLRFSRITSRYTRKRFHPVLKRYAAHLGTDYAAPPGTPVHSVGDGKVLEARYAKYNGRYVKVRHNSVYTTQYLHMSRIKKGIRPGAEVEQGEVIGYVGSTGLATGPHLCYRFWKNGRQVDPYKQEIPPAEPVKKENLPEFRKRMKQLKKELDHIPYQKPQILAEK